MRFQARKADFLLSQGFLIATFLLLAVELEELHSYYGKLSEKNNPQVSRALGSCCYSQVPFIAEARFHF